MATILTPWLANVPSGRYAFNQWATDGMHVNFQINFAGVAPGYISRNDVKYYTTDLNGTVVVPVTVVPSGAWQSDSVIKITNPDTTPIATGYYLFIFRDTPKDQPEVNFNDGSVIDETNLDTGFQQAVYAAAEMVDKFGVTQDEAGNALSIALAAKSEADSALTSSAAAVSVANTANSAAAGAVSTANSANTAAQTALSTANGIDAKATTALANSVQAESDAATALATANGLAASITTANNNASAAVTTANAANATANGLSASITTANTNASAAVTTANNAAALAAQTGATLLASATTTAVATINFDAVFTATYNSYLIVLENIKSVVATDMAFVFRRAGANVSGTPTGYCWIYTPKTIGAVSATANNNSTYLPAIASANQAIAAQRGSTGELHVVAPQNTTTYKTVLGRFFCSAAGNSSVEVQGHYLGDALANDGFALTMSGTTFVAGGIIKVYGLKN